MKMIQPFINDDKQCILKRVKSEETIISLGKQQENNHYRSSVHITKTVIQPLNSTNYTPIQLYQSLDTPEFLLKCDQFILKHSNFSVYQSKKNKSIDLIKSQIPIKSLLEQEQFKRHNRLKLISHVITISHHPSLVDQQTIIKLSKSRSLSQFSTSTILNNQILITTNQQFIQFLKSHNQKLQSATQQNKYLKIQNYTLMKAKTEIIEIKKQIQKIKNQRDMFKQKLLALNNIRKKEQQRIKVNEIGRGERNKLKNNIQSQQEILELSLTDSHDGEEESKLGKSVKSKIHKIRF